MELDKKIHIEIELGMLRDMLQRVINSEHSLLISTVIADHLSLTSQGLRDLYLALQGEKIKPKFHIGQPVKFASNFIFHSDIDKKAMEEAGMIKNNMAEGIIEEIDMRMNYPYKICHKAILKSGEPSTDSVNLNGDHIMEDDTKTIIE